MAAAAATGASCWTAKGVGARANGPAKPRGHAHRQPHTVLSTIRHVDRFCVPDAGRIIEEGGFRRTVRAGARISRSDMARHGVRRQLLLPVNDNYFCRLRGSEISIEEGGSPPRLPRSCRSGRDGAARRYARQPAGEAHHWAVDPGTAPGHRWRRPLRSAPETILAPREIFLRSSKTPGARASPRG